MLRPSRGGAFLSPRPNGVGLPRPALAVVLAVFLLLPPSVAAAHNTEGAQQYPCRFAVRYKFRQPNGTYSRPFTRKATHDRIHYKFRTGVRHINVHKVLRERPFISPDQVRALILCLFPKYGLDGSFAVGVGECESGLRPGAQNPPYYGVFQHHGDYWPSRACTYGHCGESVFSGYANTHVTAQMVRDGGWGPWSCA